MKLHQIASTIDHTLLKPEATPAQIETLCDEAKQHQFRTVCVNPLYVALASARLKDSNVDVCSVVGFPLGTSTTESKVFETQNAIQNGAHEIDMVVAIGKLKAHDDDYVQKDIHAVVQAAKGKTIKVILETALLDESEIARACQLCTKAGAHFVKTSTGFSTRGASLDDIKIMRQNISSEMKIKASGGIKTLADAKAYLDAGVHRIGTSSGVSILEQLS